MATNLLPFITYYRNNPDYNASDKSREFDLMNQRNEAIESFLEGKQSADYVLDLLESQDIDPVIYVETVEEAIRYCLEHHSEDISISFDSFL